jgi:hypothetical protein
MTTEGHCEEEGLFCLVCDAPALAEFQEDPLKSCYVVRIACRCEPQPRVERVTCAWLEQVDALDIVAAIQRHVRLRRTAADRR